MTDTPLHELYNNYNSKKRQDVKGALHGTVSVNTRLAEKHFITEAQTTRSDITVDIFEKMTKIEEIMGKSSVNSYLQKAYMDKLATLQELKATFKEKTRAQKEDEIINDIIGG